LSLRIKKLQLSLGTQGLFLIFLFLLVIGCGKDRQDASYNPAFDFNLPDLNGRIHTMDDFRDQILVLNFWATWCPPCVDEVPKLSNVYNRYKSRGIRVVSIALDKDTLNLLDQFVKKNGITYQVLVGNEQVLANLSTISKGQSFKGIPATLIFDRKGQIYKRFDGSFDLEQLEESLQTLLSQN
jgi:peroxiredoxin